MEVWMVWVGGRGKPKVMHPTYESAKNEALRLKSECGETREIYILTTHEIIPGRKLLTLRGNPQSKRWRDVEPRT